MILNDLLSEGFFHIAMVRCGFRPGVGDQTGQPQEVGRDHLHRSRIQDDPG